jgi:hypothetical protein
MSRTTILAALALLGGLAPSAARADDDDVKLPAVLEGKPLEAAKGDDELRKLLKARYNAALQETKGRFMQLLAGKATSETLADCGRRLLRSELELCDKPADRVKVREKWLTLAKEVERVQKLRYDAGRIDVAEMAQAEFNRLDAEIELLREKKAAETKSK